MRSLSILLVLLLLSSCGCGGYYVLTVPDQLAPKGGAAVPVARLQRNDFFFLALPAKKQPMRFQIYRTPQTEHEPPGKGKERGCSTDDLGYAAVEIPMSQEPVLDRGGVYFMKVSLQDFEGEEISATVPLYVWDPKKPVVAVDADYIPGEGFFEETEASAALQKIARTANILYLTRKNRRTQQRFHERLQRGRFPDGPILPWQRRRWHIVREGKFRIPKVVVESRLDSQLPQLVREFTEMNLGICGSELAGKAFIDAGMRCVIIGNSRLKGPSLIHRQSWSDLADRALP